MQSFSSRLIAWQRTHGATTCVAICECYHVWLSEIMLQQTQVATVIPYYQRFTTSFRPSRHSPLRLKNKCSPLERPRYYARGPNLHCAAQLIMQNITANFRANSIRYSTSGIGRSTAARSVRWLARTPCDTGWQRQTVLARYCASAGHPARKRWKFSFGNKRSLVATTRYCQLHTSTDDLGAHCARAASEV